MKLVPKLKENVSLLFSEDGDRNTRPPEPAVVTDLLSMQFVAVSQADGRVHHRFYDGYKDSWTLT